MRKILLRTLAGLGITVGTASTYVMWTAFRYDKEFNNSPYCLHHTETEAMANYFKYCKRISKGFKDAELRYIKYILCPTMFGWYCRNFADD